MNLTKHGYSFNANIQGDSKGSVQTKTIGISRKIRGGNLYEKSSNFAL